MGVLIAGLVLAPFVAGAAVLDLRARRHKRRTSSAHHDHRGERRELDTSLDIGDLN